MATDTEPTESTPLDTSLKKFLAGSKKPTDTGVRYDPGVPAVAAPTEVASFRPAVSDVINLSQAPGLNYTPAEKWAHESAVAQLALEQQKFGLTERQFGLEEQQFALDKRASDFENTMRGLQLMDYMKNKGSAGSVAAAAANNARFGYNTQFRPSSGIRPGFTQVSSINLRPPILPTMPGFQGKISWIPPGMSGGAVGTAVDQANKAALAQGKNPPVFLQMPNY